MRRFLAALEPHDDTTILDVGGNPVNWDLIDARGKITLLNLPSANVDGGTKYEVVAGDGTDLDYPDGSFDIVFSNSTIEHVGSLANQVRFANEVRRVGDGVWVQTPARGFFIEPHYLTPFIHWLPKTWQRRLVRNCTVWGLIARPSEERAAAIVEELRLLTRAEFTELFPDCEIRTERFLGMPKSYVAVREMRET